jgi:hypothetical protein
VCQAKASAVFSKQGITRRSWSASISANLICTARSPMLFAFGARIRASPDPGGTESGRSAENLCRPGHVGPAKQTAHAKALVSRGQMPCSGVTRPQTCDILRSSETKQRRLCRGDINRGGYRFAILAPVTSQRGSVGSEVTSVGRADHLSSGLLLRGQAQAKSYPDMPMALIGAPDEDTNMIHAGHYLAGSLNGLLARNAYDRY